MENHIATAEDFRRLAESEAWQPAERVVLPKCGLAVLLRRPKPLAYTLLGVAIPERVAARASVAEADSEVGSASDDDRQQALTIAARVVELSFVKPKVSFNPGPDEIDPRWIPAEDYLLVLRYLGGEIDAHGADLMRFRGGAAQPGESGRAGEAIRAEAVNALEGSN